MPDTDSRRRYEIVVRGRLSSRYESAFDGVTLVASGGQTTLYAELADQAQLNGLLNRLRDFGIDLISVNAVAEVPRAVAADAHPPAGA